MKGLLNSILITSESGTCPLTLRNKASSRKYRNEVIESVPYDHSDEDEFCRYPEY